MRSDENNLDEEFRQFALYLKVITEDEKLKKPTEFIMKRIELELKRNHLDKEFLFIFDNCDSIKETAQYFDFIIQDISLKNIKFLMTTRTGDPFQEFGSNTMAYIGKFSQNIIIEPFDKEESINYLKYNLNDVIRDKNEINELISLFDIQNERPVILNKLIALVKLKMETTNDIIEEFKQNKRQLEALDEELFENLINKEEIAWQVLKHCSFLDSEFSPCSIYTDLFKMNEDEFYDALDALAKLSLISKEEDNEGMEYGIRIHRTLQNEVKQFLELKYENSIKFKLAIMRI